MRYAPGTHTIAMTAVAVLLAACSVAPKEPDFAGKFYPANRQDLRETVEGYLERAQKANPPGDLVALIAPHAGYEYSGHVAAAAYSHVGDVRTVVIIASSHSHSFSGASVWTEGSFRTPLGRVGIDRKVARALMNPTVGVDYMPEYFRNEHAIEVHLPFLQRKLGRFRLVPVLVGRPTTDLYAYLAETLTGLMADDPDILLVASTDLSHYHDYDTAVRMDRDAIRAIETLHGPVLEERLRAGKVEMCGEPAVLLAMEVARRRGANTSVLYRYANSGDVTGNRDKVVGYAAMGIYRSPLQRSDKEELLAIARKSIIERVQFGKAADVFSDNPRLHAHGAAFVTITRNGRLRGCLGHVEARMPLITSVQMNAVAASSYDQRFPPLRPEELEDMVVEVSVLSPLTPIKDVDRLEVGRHGLFIVKKGQTGLLLPQVAVAEGWDRRTFLEQVAVKAGMEPDAWRDADLYTFEAQVASEAELGVQFEP
jgi:AmmeMemoRadiSam system protein B/AmmeMemoRadiSam system protein A